jgi:argininosuccinate synthase
MKSKNIKRAALAYSGGLDTSIIIPWLREKYGCEVVAVAIDVGQGVETEGLKEKALRSGAAHFELVDVRDEFAADYLFKVLRAGAIYERTYLLGTSTARPLIARKLAEVATATGCDALVHGCTGKGNDQVRFELAWQALVPELEIIAPWREWTINSREEAIDYANANGIPVPVTKKEPYSRDRNLWHVSHEGGRIEDPEWSPDPSIWQMTVDPRNAPDIPERVAIDFRHGTPEAIDGVSLSPREIIEVLNQVGGRHGIGRVDLVENRLIGIKSRGLYETPGGTILIRALEALESITLDRESAHEKERIALRYAELVYFGQWFTPLREALDAFVERITRNVTGTITLELYKGNLTTISRSAEATLYASELASFDMTGYDSSDAAGFIRLFGLQTKGTARDLIERPAERARAAGSRR